MSLLNQWKNRPKTIEANAPLVKAPLLDFYPLSRGQQRLFFLDRLYPNNPVYNSSEVYTFRGPLNVEKLKTSLQIIFSLNEVLKCSFHFVDGKPIQKVNHDLVLKVSEYDLSTLSLFDKKRRQEEIMKTDSLCSFNLSDAPLIRASILKLGTEEHLLFITVHHIITDKWSIGLFQEQLLKYYKNVPSVEELDECKSNLQFVDYAYWQQESTIDTVQLDYWKQKLSGEIPHLELPTDYPETVSSSFKGGSIVQQLTKELSTKIIELSKKLETTPYVLLLAVYNVMLSRYSGQKDILIGSPISVRGSKALENIIGFFDETIVLRNSIAQNQSFEEFVKSVRISVLDAFSNKEVTFDLLVKELRPERSISTNPFFRTMFIYHDVEKFVFSPEIDMSYTFYNSGIAKFDLTLYISNEEGILSTEFEYAKDLFEDVSIERLQEHFRLLLEGVTTDSSSIISKIPMLTKEEQLLFFDQKLIENNNPYSKYSAIHEIIIDQAKNNPNSIAVVFENESITYKDFDEQSNKVAEQILKYSKGENQIVGLCFERSIKMMVGLLGILKAGCAYLPLDLNYPSKRIDFILKDSNVKILLTQKDLKSKFQNFGGELLHIKDQEVNDADENGNLVLPNAEKESLAYVIYTSGSTGNPKGVPITHSNIISSNEARLDFYSESPSAFLLMSSISFDSSKAGIFWTLCTGGTLVISKEQLEQDIEALSQVILSNAVSHTLMLPSLYKMLLELGSLESLKSLETVIVAGEKCTTVLCQEHFKKLPETKLYNEYGPTEATVWCIAHKVEKDVNDAVIPIGKATSNAEVYLLNSEREAVPLGATGEIYIGGKGLANGYLNKPELTKSAYLPHPYSKNTEDVLYKTGDLGRYRNDGAIEFLGRTDHQVKIRGFRIELNEIENVLLNNEDVQEAIVISKTSDLSSENNTTRLVAYVVAKVGFDNRLLMRNLTSELPSYMIPSSIIRLEKLPELPNGKVDKIALQEIGQKLQTRAANIKPTSEIESKLVLIWQQILNQTDFGIRDNYFEIGGDSLTSIKMFWLIEKQMNVKLSPSLLFKNPTIEKIAARIESCKIQKVDSFNHIVPYRIEGDKRPLFCIHGGEGHVLFYQNFADHLNSNRPVYLVQPKGVNGEDELHLSIEHMAEDYIKEIIQISDDDFLNLAFYCCGALVVEISNQLKAIGKKANIMIIDSSPKYMIEGEESKSKLRYNYFLKRILKDPITTIKKSLAYRFRRRIIPVLIPLIKNDLEKRHIKIRTQLEQVQQHYEWKNFDAQCTLILGEEGLPEFDKKDIDGWNHWCNSEVQVLYNSGNHFNIFEMPHAKSLGEIAEGICL